MGINWGWRPPLTKELFEPKVMGPDKGLFNDRRRNVEESLSHYPRARSLRGDIALRLSDSEGDRAAETLEQVLMSFRDGSRNRFRRFQQVPFFLRELLGEVSAKFIKNGVNSGENFDVLLDNLLEAFDEVLFVTLNYDLFLEKAIETVANSVPGAREALGMGWYIQDPHWKLVKLHGSVDWVRAFTPPASILGDLPSDNVRGTALEVLDKLFIDEVDLGEIELVLKWDRWRNGAKFLYPAIAVPVDDARQSSICPREHEQAAEQFLTDCENYLFLGTRGKDNDLVQLLSKSGACRVVGIVAQGEEDCKETQSNLQEALDFSSGPQIYYSSGFTGFVRDGGLADFLEASHRTGLT